MVLTLAMLVSLLKYRARRDLMPHEGGDPYA